VDHERRGHQRVEVELQSVKKPTEPGGNA